MKGGETVGDTDRARTTIRFILLGVMGLGLGIRLLYFWDIAGTALPRIQTVVQSDIRTYWEWAQQIRSGDLLGAYHAYNSYLQQIAPLDTWYRWWGGKEIFRTAPLFPYWVAGLLALSKGSVSFVFLVQLLVGALQPLILFALARRLFDARVGLVAAALTAGYGPFIFYQGVLLRDWLPPLLEPLALLTLVRARDSRRGRDWILAGLALGVALLAKETVLLILPLMGLWLFWETWPDRRGAIRAGAYIVLGLWLALAPLLVRNALVGAPLFALSNRAAQSFIEANAADGAPVGWMPVPETMRQILERSDGKLVPMIRETLRTYQGDYGAFFRRLLLKLRALADPNEVPGEEVSFAYGLGISPGLRFTLRYGFIFPLGIGGLLLALPTWRRQRLLHFYFLAVGGGQMFGTVLERFRLTLVPVLLLYAAVWLVRLFDVFREKRFVGLSGGVCLILGVAAIQHFWIPLRGSEGYGPGAGYFPAARVYAAEGRFDRAVAEMVRLRGMAGADPQTAGMVSDALLLEGKYRALWADHLLGQGKRDEARQQVERAEAALASHLHLADPCYNLGVLYLRLNEAGKAKTFLDRFLTLEPEGPRAAQVRRLLAGLKDSS
jgi:hypothetical protein